MKMFTPLYMKRRWSLHYILLLSTLIYLFQIIVYLKMLYEVNSSYIVFIWLIYIIYLIDFYLYLHLYSGVSILIVHM